MNCNATFTWTGEWRFSCVAAPVSHQVLLPRECLTALHAVVGSLRLYAHVKLDVTVEVLTPGVGLGAALVCAVEQPLPGGGVVGPGADVGRPGVVVGPRPVMSVGVQRGQHGHRDRAVRVPLGPNLGVESAPTGDAGPVKILLMPRKMLLPLEIFTTNSAEERSLRLLTEMGDLRKKKN